MANETATPGVEVNVPPSLPADSTVPTAPPRPAQQRFMIRNVDWATYRKISEALGTRHYRLSYDGENLELMTKSKGHGMYSRFFYRLIAILTEVLGLALESCGDMTCDNENVERAIEPDECFYIENAPRVMGREKVNLNIDPPPDLAVEVDLTTDARRRLGIYAALRVPEIWRYDGRAVTVHQRQADGTYAVVEGSRFFPLVTAADLTRFLQQRGQTDENTLLNSFRDWVRGQVGTGA